LCQPNSLIPAITISLKGNNRPFATGVHC
jgi:hypothetical protein